MTHRLPGEAAGDLPLPTIGVMILNRDGRNWLEPLYESLRRQDYPRLKVYLVDNASADDSVALTLENYPEVRVLRFSENLGYSMAYNQAMPHAFEDGCDWVVWANNDVLLESGCLLELGKAATTDPKLGVLGPAFFAWDSNEPNYYMKGKHPQAIGPMQQGDPTPVDVDWVEGSFLMVSADCVTDVGWLDPYLFFYWEETDFCRRALRKGWRVALAPAAIARHYAGGWSSGDQANTHAANHLKSRNQYIYAFADPNHAFVLNALRGAHLFLVLCKAALKTSPAALAYELKAFGRLFPELGDIRAKWKRDRRGVSPSAVSAKYAHVSLDVVRGAS